MDTGQKRYCLCPGLLSDYNVMPGFMWNPCRDLQWGAHDEATRTNRRMFSSNRPTTRRHTSQVPFQSNFVQLFSSLTLSHLFFSSAHCGEDERRHWHWLWPSLYMKIVFILCVCVWCRGYVCVFVDLVPLKTRDGDSLELVCAVATSARFQWLGKTQLI